MYKAKGEPMGMKKGCDDDVSSKSEKKKLDLISNKVNKTTLFIRVGGCGNWIGSSTRGRLFALNDRGGGLNEWFLSRISLHLFVFHAMVLDTIINFVFWPFSLLTRPEPLSSSPSLLGTLENPHIMTVSSPNHTEIIHLAEELVRKHMSQYDPSHDWWHVNRVRNTALKLAKALKEDVGEEKHGEVDQLDMLVAELTALFHDMADGEIQETGKPSRFHDLNQSPSVVILVTHAVPLPSYNYL